VTAADLVNMGLASFQTGEVVAALDFWKEARTLSDDPLIDMNIGFALNHLARFDEALPFMESAYVRNHEDKRIKVAWADTLIRNGRWLEAWEIYNPSIMPTKLDIPVPAWKGEKLFGKDVLVVADGGYGDTIMFARYLPEFKKLGARVSLLNSPALVPLFYDQPYLKGVNQATQRKFDCWITQFDVPKIFGVTPENVLWPEKYIVPNGEWFWQRENDMPHIGLCWTSTEKGHHYRFRSLLREQAKRLFDVPGIQWVSLQYDLPAPPGAIEPTINSWMDTANLIASLDLVVTIDTAILHLAGAMGVPTWALLGGFVDGKFLKSRTDCVWYPSVELFRNGEFGFENTITSAISRLQEYARQFNP